MRFQHNGVGQALIFGFLFLVWTGTSACSFTGSIGNNFHDPTGGYGQKLSLRVALVADPPLKTQQVKLLNGDAKINLYPGLVNATVTELKTVFDEVRVVDHPGQAKEDDLLAFVRFGIEPIGSDTFNDHYVYGCRLSILLRDQFGRSIAMHEDTRQFEYRNPGNAQVAAFLTGLSLFLASPVTIPWYTYSTWSHARGLLEESIDNSLQSISYRISNDGQLLAYSRTVQRMPTPPIAGSSDEPSASSTAIPESQGQSKQTGSRTTALFTTGSHVAPDPTSPTGRRRFVVWSENPGVASAVTEVLQKSGHIIVERSHLQSVINEQKLRLTHTSDDEADLLHVGKLIGADRMVFAAVTTRPEVINLEGGPGGDSLTVYHTSVAVRGVSVESGEVRWSGTAQPRTPINNPELAAVGLVQWAMARAFCPVEEGYEWRDPDGSTTTKAGCNKKE